MGDRPIHQAVVLDEYHWIAVSKQPARGECPGVAVTGT
jgi:hypothetical protein